MKIMVLSDVHGKTPALEKALAIYKKESFDRLFILGDILYHGPRNPLPDGYAPPGVVESLNPLKGEITAIRGNCDSEVDQMLLEFPIMADYAIYEGAEHRFILTHGHLDASRLPALMRGDVRLSGHTHIPVLEELEGVCYFNPGSISLPKGGFAPSFGVIEGGSFSVRLLEKEENLLTLNFN